MAEAVTGRSGASRGWRRRAARWAEPLRWTLLGVAVLVLVVFLVAQRQSTDVSYGESPATAAIPEGSAGELTDASVPSVAEMTALVAAEPVVRLPGAVATWDEQQVREVIGDSDTRILVAPPGLDKAERDLIRDVENATVRVVGTEVSGGIYQAVPDTIPSWRARFATHDVTGSLVALIANLRDRPTPPDVDPLTWRDPAPAELAAVAADLRAHGRHVAPGATLTGVPEKAAAAAFPAGARYVALPYQAPGEPLPRYGPALAGLFPDTPIVVLYGSWVEYHGPEAEQFADIAAATFYAQFGDRLSRYAYPQDNVLGAWLDRVTEIRYAGVFERPLPYRPFDPLRVALPALPWIFAGCVLVFLILSVRSLPRVAGLAAPVVRGPGVSSRLAGLTALAVEMSLLTDRRSDPALVRGIAALGAAREALDERLPASQVRRLLADAEAELDAAARTMAIPAYRPSAYLRGRLS
ncbi:hypothetical protein O7627_35075 [Solwaraspora sp. WMMD1047]|uniref:hypothetical protein n=1 Tax=Solwaraspora sp. WMMD1047 TaxID=3016102 RepID=UPI002415D3F1|nr:hypothetical protein [Solwaraspora sp. WMMD1047]MDG4834493.1 hypothetical protein [Solwaraspora sp. WMMD1047]